MRLTDAEAFRNSLLRHRPGQTPDLFHLSIVEFRHAVALAPNEGSVPALILCVVGTCPSSQITETAVARISIGKVTALHAGRTRSNKALKNQPANAPSVSTSQTDDSSATTDANLHATPDAPKYQKRASATAVT